MTCSTCHGRLTWGDVLIPLFRVNLAGDIEPMGYAHAHHYTNSEADE